MKAEQQYTDEYGGTRAHYFFRDRGQRDATWLRICQQVNAPHDLDAIHISKGKYFEPKTEKLSIGETEAVRLEKEGRPAIMVYFSYGSANPVISALEETAEVERDGQ